MEPTVQSALNDRLQVVDEFIYRLERGLQILSLERTALVEALEASRTADKRRGELPDLSLEEALASIGVPFPKARREPSLPEKIVEVLAVAHKAGDAALSPKEIASRIRARWGSAAPHSSVGPVTWRLAQAGKLFGESGLYRLNADSGRSEPHD